ncbi:MAG: response regulator [Dehalococcoidia bacterium]|nr:response regulator [Dehalococcoidia bacterium]
MQELLTPHELARYLKLNHTTVIRKANKGEIPAIKIGKQFRFDKDQIDKWLFQQTVGRPAHILVIDDEPVIGQLFRDSLEKNGYHVTTMLSSLEALELVARQHFDLIFLDLAMPELDGSELFRRIRNTDKQVPVAIITGYPDSELLIKAKEHGPFMIMIKPFTDNEILQAVHTFNQQPMFNNNNKAGNGR